MKHIFAVIALLLLLGCVVPSGTQPRDQQWTETPCYLFSKQVETQSVGQYE
jgi:outer membrane biogenesis lipoprotein LolB